MSVTEPSSQTGLYHLLKRQADLHPEAIALTAPGRPPLTYRDLLRQVDDTIAACSAMGLGRSDRIAMVLPNGPEMAAAFLGVTSCAASAPLNPAYQLREFDFHLTDIGASALLVQAGADTAARSVAAARGIRVIELVPVPEGPSGAFRLVGDAASSPAAPGPARGGDVALLLHTSGTTARPKLVPLTQTNLCTSACNIAASLEFSEADRCLNVMPLFHAHGIMTPLLGSMAAGASVACAPGFDPASFFSWMSELRPTWYSAVPTIHQAVLDAAPRHRQALASCPLRFVRSASSPLPADVLTALETTFGAPVIEAYGMTETSSVITSNPLPPRPRKLGSVGISIGCDIAIVNERGDPLPRGETGEIVLRGPTVMDGYEHNPEADTLALVNGWFRTGDQGFLDREGYLFIKGRIKEVINRGGMKVSPPEVDAVLMAHPDVAQAVTFPMPHPTLGEDVAAAIVPREAGAVIERDVYQFAAARLAAHKVPSRLFVLPEIPKSGTGKVQRLRLAERLAAASRPAFVAPRNEVERALAAMWAELLGLPQIGTGDNFFDLGGNSLLIVQLQDRLRRELGQELSLVDLFDHPTVGSLADHLTRTAGEAVHADRPDDHAEQLRQGGRRLLRQREQGSRRGDR